MDSTEQEPLSPLYEYTATVWVARTYKVVAENDDHLEEVVHQAMENDGLAPEEFSLVRLQSTRTPIHWQ
jgi:hypothetical protein